MHYSPNGNFDRSGTYLPGVDGFNLADVNSAAQAWTLPAGVEGLVYLGTCGGVTPSFVRAAKTNSKVFGFYLMDEPNPSYCTPAHLRAESDWIHLHDTGDKTFIVLLNLGATSAPTYANSYNLANTHIDLFGLDPYPCRTEFGDRCAFSWVGLSVTAAENAGVPLADIVPVFQAFGGGTYRDDRRGHYWLPTATQETALLSTWHGLVPSPVFDYAYSWGVQSGDMALSGSAALQLVFATHNAS